MKNSNYKEDAAWKEILMRLSQIRESGEVSGQDVELIRASLSSFDERVRGGAALAAEGCLLEPYILDLLTQIVETDTNDAIRKAAIHSLKGIIYTGVLENLETEEGATTQMDDVEEWDESQAGSLLEDYQRVKYLLMELLQDEMEDISVREAALSSLSDLGFLPEIRLWIEDFFHSESKSMKIVALQAMGKFPHFWEEPLAATIAPETDKDILMEAISACYSAQSPLLASRIEKILSHPDPDVLGYCLMTLANMNLTENLTEILQRFSLHSDSRVQEKAKDAIDLLTRRNFGKFLQDNLGLK